MKHELFRKVDTIKSSQNNMFFDIFNFNLRLMLILNSSSNNFLAIIGIANMVAMHSR